MDTKKFDDLIVPVSERFISFQGEGIHIGEPTYFIRLAGCNLAIDHGGCVWCDTKYAQKLEQGKGLTIKQIMDEVPREYPGRICVTGGEPLFYEHLVVFLNLLMEQTLAFIFVETNGCLPLPPRSRDNGEKYVYSMISWSMDIKCPSSGMASFNVYDNIERLQSHDQLKFVVGDRKDFDFVKRILKKYHRFRGPAIIQPAYGQIAPDMLAAWILEDRIPCHLILQQHKTIWGQKRGV